MIKTHLLEDSPRHIQLPNVEMQVNRSDRMNLELLN